MIFGRQLRVSVAGFWPDNNAQHSQRCTPVSVISPSQNAFPQVASTRD
jgi:hypothetical protein